MSVFSPLGQSRQKESIGLDAQTINEPELLAFKSRQAVGIVWFRGPGGTTATTTATSWPPPLD